MARPPLVAIVGPTASGKSTLAVELAKAVDGEVVSADSMQVYRYFDIGTAKPTLPEMQGVPHHMIDVVSPHEPFSVSDYRKQAMAAIEDILCRGKKVILCGGTGLYIRALTRGLADTPEGDCKLRRGLRQKLEEGGSEALHEQLKKIDPAAAKSIHPNNVVRVIRAIEVAMLSGRKLSEYQSAHQFADAHFDLMMLGIDVSREALYARIESRVDKMIAGGLVEEVKVLLERGYGRDLKPMRSIGYKEVCAHLIDGLPLADAVELIKRDSRRYAKRQMTWFRKEDVSWGGFEELASGRTFSETTEFLSS
ncbi:MAG: tRNA (adenosine(37)-N6)-dimethylallyltransferase MiaA [Proteobacteria bacterium]|nr:tRNA (adenosine(37)-N6)-dimethylallyltransferase MiaA [Pseudomonadota bacterium]